MQICECNHVSPLRAGMELEHVSARSASLDGWEGAAASVRGTTLEGGSRE